MVMNYKNFNAIVFTGDPDIGNKGFITYRKQTSVSRFKTFCDTKYPKWRWFTMYDRKTNDQEIIRNSG